MFIRLFANASNKDEAIKIFNNTVSCGSLEISTKEIVKIKPYWKMKNIFVVEGNIDFLNPLDSTSIKFFLSNIADNWLFWGEPVKEALASYEKCTYIKDGVNMINIFI